MDEQMTGGQAVVRTLAANGVEVAFGIPGVHTLAIYDALIDGPIRHVLARHEQGAGFMADGYARASGRPGVALVITGPGVTNIATPVGEAYTDSSAVLVVASGNDRHLAGKMVGDLHEMRDQTGVMSLMTAWASRASAVDQVPGLIAEAISRMTRGRPRPTYVEVPRDVLGLCDDATIAVAPAPICLAPAPGVIADAVRVIGESKRIVIYAGGGVITSGAGTLLLALAERLGAPIVNSILGKGGVPEDHPRVIGNLWEPGNAVDELLRAADLAIVVGSKLGAQDTENQSMPLPARLIRIDIDPTEVERHYPPTVAIVADAAATVEALLGALASDRITRIGSTDPEVAEIKRRARETGWGHAQDAYIAALRRAIPRDGILVNDMTMMSYVACRRYPVYEPRTFLMPVGYATLGFSLPAAIGAKVARPDRMVVAICGDGGFQYTMGELGVAVQERLGLPIVIFNDSTYTAVKEAQAREQGGRFFAVDLVNPDFVALAGAYGIPGVRANSPEELTREIVAAAARDLPTIIDTPIRFDY